MRSDRRLPPPLLRDVPEGADDKAESEGQFPPPAAPPSGGAEADVDRDFRREVMFAMQRGMTPKEAAALLDVTPQRIGQLRDNWRKHGDAALSKRRKRG